MDFWLCFTCPARYCELLPGDLGSGAIFLQDLIDQALNCFHLSAAVITVELDFFLPESAYSAHINIRCDAHPGAIPSDMEALKLAVESIVSQVMLQCFWEIHSLE